jgi:hypothetical protein
MGLVPSWSGCCTLIGPVFCLGYWVPVERLQLLPCTALCVVVILVKVKGENESRINESIMWATRWKPEWVTEGLEQTGRTNNAYFPICASV